MKEMWKDIEGYDGRYQISNMGRVKSLVVDKDGRLRKPQRNYLGYMTVILYDAEGQKKTHTIHRLVANAFIPNPCGYPEINHKDENKENNCVDNLEWCDRNYNINFGTTIARITVSHINNPLLSLPVYSVDENGNMEFFKSIGEAERKTGFHHSNIVRTLKGRTVHCGKRRWFYCSPRKEAEAV